VYDREERSRLAVEQGILPKNISSCPAARFCAKFSPCRVIIHHKESRFAMNTLLPTSTAGSLPKPSWLAEPEKLWSPWKQEGEALHEAKRDALLLSLQNKVWQH
jgi:hypothetical protein